MFWKVKGCDRWRCAQCWVLGTSVPITLGAVIVWKSIFVFVLSIYLFWLLLIGLLEGEHWKDEVFDRRRCAQYWVLRIAVGLAFGIAFVLNSVVLLLCIMSFLFVLAIFERSLKPNVKKLRAKRDVMSLIQAAYNKDPSIRREAQKALFEIGDPLAIRELVDALTLDQMLPAAEALVKIGEPAIKSLIPKINSKMVMDVLVKIGTPSVEPLVTALTKLGMDAGEQLSNVVRSLTMLGWQPDKSEAAAIYWANLHNYEQCEVIGASAVKPLIYCLKDGDASAAKALVKIGSPAVESLIAVVENKVIFHPVQRNMAAWILGLIGDVRAVQPLLDMLKDAEDKYLSLKRGLVELTLIQANKNERLTAIMALDQIGDLRAVEPLNVALMDSDCEVWSAALEALVKLGGPAVKLLISAMETSPVPGQFFDSFFDRLNWIDSLAEALRKIARAENIEELIVELLAPLLKSSESWTRGGAVKALIKIGGQRTTALLTTALKDENVYIRDLAAEGLNQTLHELISHQSDTNNFVDKLKCVNCGATFSVESWQCPVCGFCQSILEKQ